MSRIDKARAIADSCGFEIDTSTLFKPKNVRIEYTKLLFVDMPDSLRRYAKELFKEQGWRIYVVESTRGSAYCRDKVITIPLWAIRKGPLYKAWYIAHEMAHAFAWIHDKHFDGHGPKFMEWLKLICPAESIHFELGYKPRNAMAAGIREPSADKFSDGSIRLSISDKDWL